MNETLKKIYEERAKHKTLVATCKEESNSMYHLGVGDGLELARQIVQAEHDKLKTKGDVIRESNERLARHIHQNPNDCQYCINNFKVNNCLKSRCIDGILNYLNQPVEEE